MADYITDVVGINAGMDAFRADYAATMRAQGVTVTWLPQDALAGGPFGQVEPGRALLSRDGATTEVLVSAGRAAGSSGSALATFDIDYNLRFAVQTSGQPLPSRWYQPEGSRGVPGPATTVPTTHTNAVQTAQTPPAPDAGTIVRPLGRDSGVSFNTGLTGPTQPAIAAVGDTGLPTFSADLMAKSMGFDQWNYYYQALTGRTGPPPEAVGAQRGPLYKVGEWWALVKGWYGGGGGVVAPAPPAGGLPPANPPPVVTNDSEMSAQKTAALVVAGLVLLLRVAR